MIETLVGQGIEVYRLDRSCTSRMDRKSCKEQMRQPRSWALTAWSLTSPMTMEVPLGSYIVFLNQPQRSNVLALFAPQIYPNRLTAQGEAERPYDVAGWTLPLQMGLDAPAVTAIKETPAERRLTLVKDGNQVRADLALPLRRGDESPIKNPVRHPVRVGIYRPWMSNMDEGWTRFVFDTFNVPYSSVRDADVRQGGLNSKFDVLILTSQASAQIVGGNAAGTAPRGVHGWNH